MTPYKGLASFADTELDARLFFGRDRERETVVANVLANRLTVVYGPSGVGKSSLLRAGVAQQLRAEGTGAVVVHDRWNADPVGALIDSVRDELPGLGATAGLVDTVAAAAQAHGEVFVLLDQFEDYFTQGDGALVAVLPELLRRPGLRLSVLIALRDDALAQLDAFTARLPETFGNLLRLEPLDRHAARAAIVGPLAAYGELTDRTLGAEPSLVESLVADVGAGRVETPFLQLVLERLWAEDEASGELRLATLERLGGAEAIARDHIQGALDRLAPADRETAARVIRQLVTPSGAKASHTEADLAEYTGVARATLQPLLAQLAQERIVRAVGELGDGGARYEIYHDVLAEPLLAWRQAQELRRARRQSRRSLAVAAASVLALVVVAAIAVFALTQRSAARAQARRARAHELAAQALAGLATTPTASLRLALHAARLSADAESTSVLRSSLLAVREEHVIRLGGNIVAASFAGGELLAASSDGRVALYRADGTLVRRLPRQPALTHAVWSADGTEIATGGENGTATIWDARTGHALRAVHTPAPVTALSFVKHVLLVGSGGHLHVVYGTHGTTRKIDVAGAVVAAGLSPDGQTIAVASKRRGRVTTQLVSVSTRRVRATLPEHGVESLAFSPDGKLLATGSTDKTARLWRVATGRLVHVLPQRGYVVAERFAGPLLLTASTDGTAAIWDVASGRRQLLLTGANGAAQDVVLSPDGSEFAVAFADRFARLYSTADGRLLAPLAGHASSVTSVSFSGRMLATGSDDGTVRLWDANESNQLVPTALRVPPTPARSMYGRIAAVPEGRNVQLVDVQNGHVLHTLIGHRSLVTDAEFSPNGKLLVTSSVDHDARIWDVRTGRLVRVLRGHFFPVYAAAFSADGQWIVTASQFTAGLWNAQTGQLVEYLRGAPAPLTNAVFRGTTIVAAAKDGSYVAAPCVVCRNLPGLEQAAQARLSAIARP